MKVKEIERTANVAWSPAQQHPMYIAAGSAAQQLDATFSTTAALELYSLDLAEPSIDMDLVHSISCESRFHKLQWGWMNQYNSMGYIFGGSDNGKIVIFDADKLAEKQDAQVACINQHKGPVLSLDVSPATNMLASGAGDSEVYLWEMHRPDQGVTLTPSTPGKSLPSDDVTYLAWNRVFSSILATTLAGRCVVWDLRKADPVVRITDSMARIKSKILAWHPEFATQICIASEDDHTPVVQLWDLRYCSSALKSFEGHTRGILSMAWCAQDSDLLLTCGKDNRILGWNPNTQAPMGEIVYELPSSDQWSFDIQWCPRNPSLISTCSFDSRISVFSLTGGAQPLIAPSSRIDESFPNDPFAPIPQQIQQPKTSSEPPVMLKKPPKWLRRPVGASFGFGGRLVTFNDPMSEHKEKVAHATHQPVQPGAVHRQVHLSQVVTEPNLVHSSQMLEQALNEGKLVEYCTMKIANCAGAMEENIWKFMKGHFESDPRRHYMELLGYTEASLAQRLGQLQDTEELEGELDRLNTGVSVARDGDSSASSTAGAADDFEQIAEQQEQAKQDSLAFATGDDTEGLVTRALLMGNYEAAVQVCFQTGRMAEAMILAMAGGPSLTQRTQKRFFDKHKDSFNKLLACVVNRDFENVMKTCELKNWREALALAVTYAQSDQLSHLCDILGTRLEACEDRHLAANACLCYVCAGNVSRLVECWSRLTPHGNTPTALQNLVEKAMILQRTQAAAATPNGILAQKLTVYAGLLAAQGSFTTAMTYLGNSQEGSLAVLRDRLYNALPANLAATMQAPAKPFGLYVPTPPAQQQQQPQQNRQTAGRQTAAAGRYDSSRASQSQPTSSGAAAYGYMGQTAQPVQPANVPTFQPSYHPTSSTYQQAATPYQPTSAPYQPAPFQPTTAPYQPVQPAMYNPQGQPTVANRGPLAHKYQPEMTPAANHYQQQPLNPAVSSAAYSQPQLFNPAAVTSQPLPGGPSAAGASIGSPSQFRGQEAGWNDPPAVSEKPKSAKHNQAPFTYSSYGAMNPANPEQTPPGAPSYIGNTHIYNPQEYQAPAPAPAPEPPRPVERGPVPMEHQVLQRVLDSLAQICLTRASNNPHIKRKLEDVVKKLEILYDKLREQSLSPGVMDGLHQMIVCIQGGDYVTAMQYQAHLVSHSNFSEIGGFMPGVKMLLQTAQQMQVVMQ